MSGQYVNLLHADEANPMVVAFQNLAHALGILGLWLGLPEVVLQSCDLSDVSSLTSLMAWLSADDRTRVAEGRGTLVGNNLAVPAAQFVSQNESPERLNWAAIPLPIEGYPPGLLLLARHLPFQHEELSEAVGQTLSMTSLYIERALYKTAADQYRSSLEALQAVSLRMASTVANQAAIAIQNTRLYQGERSRRGELSALIDLCRLIGQQFEPEHIYHAAYITVQRLMPADAFVISLVDRHTRKIVVDYLIDKGVRYPPAPQSAGVSLSEYVMHNGEAILFSDLTQQSTPFKGVRFGERTPVCSLVAVPIHSGAEIIGILSTQSYQPQAYTQRDQELLQTVADHISIAIENAYLYSDLKNHYQSLQEANRLRLEFIQNVSHELRTPLTFLTGYTELLLGDELGTLSNDQRQTISLIQSQTDALVGLVEDLAALDSSGREWLSLQPVDLRRVLSDAISVAEGRARQNEVHIFLAIPDNFPPIQADPDRLAQALSNLFDHAIRLAKPKTEIIIVAQHSLDRAVVSIFNQGDALSRQEQDRLFESYYQTGLRTPDGSFGLAIARHIVEAHQGKVWIESAEGVGNTFCFSLPHLPLRIVATEALK